jgi:hypothetical protein
VNWCSWPDLGPSLHRAFPDHERMHLFGSRFLPETASWQCDCQNPRVFTVVIPAYLIWSRWRGGTATFFRTGKLRWVTGDPLPNLRSEIDSGFQFGQQLILAACLPFGDLLPVRSGLLVIGHSCLPWDPNEKQFAIDGKLSTHRSYFLHRGLLAGGIEDWCVWYINFLLVLGGFDSVSFLFSSHSSSIQYIHRPFLHTLLGLLLGRAWRSFFSEPDPTHPRY